MSDVMAYETLDWNAEAIRVARAFGLDEAYYFEEVVSPAGKTRLPHYHHLCWKDRHGGYTFPDHEGVIFVCLYMEKRGRNYCYERDYGRANTGVRIDWNGKTSGEVNDAALAPLLAKGLFHLGLLTPEIEAALKVSISAHEKLEWQREYEARYGN